MGIFTEHNEILFVNMIDLELHAILDLLALELLERCKAANIKWLQAM